ncbi:MAG: DNA mismatch repair protein MutS [Armatimonadota bacterium]|nr:DNA mismatch repair protein MutS [Armatimonadota bacterium]
MDAKKITPLVAQYKAIKDQYPDVILMFRLGDFYEMFGDDAITASKELEIVLTSRSQGYAADVPMCGVPYHAVDKYVAKLISRGYRVAICDQLEDPKKAKKIVKRGVTRVVTPGTVLEDGMLEAKANNYLVAVASEPSLYGLAVVDISTGEFAVTEISQKNGSRELLDEISRLAPAEVLLKELDWDLETPIRANTKAAVTKYECDRLYRKPARDLLLEHFGTESLRGFGAEHMTAALEAAAMVIDYLRQTNQNALASVSSMSTYSTSGYMILDSAARRHLELTQSLAGTTKGASLLSVIDQTKTAMGGRLLKKWLDQPLLDVDAINRRLDSVEDFYNNALMRKDVRDQLNHVQDLERLMSRIVVESANPRDLVALAQSLRKLPGIAQSLEAARSERLRTLRQALEYPEAIVELIESAIVQDPPATVRDGGIIAQGYSSELDELRAASTDGKSWVASLEARERERTGIKNLKVGYNSVFGYYIEVTKPNLHLVPDDYIRKQTTTNSERFITPALKEIEAKILHADEMAAELEYQLFCEVRSKIAEQSRTIGKVARALAEIDVLSSLAEVAALRGYCRPVVNEGEEIRIKNGRHPVVEVHLQEGFVPNDTYVNCDSDQLLIITGPNMAGKSTYLRQVALITLLAQMGSFVPADEAVIGVVDRIFTRVGAHDELASGQSTFMVEMNETANILNNATRRSLIVLDEIGRGTSTYDGLSIAWAVAEEINKISARTLFATHYHHLNDLERQLRGVKNYRITVREEKDRIVWLRKIVPGGTDKSYGIEVARLAGIPQSTIDRAREILKELEADGTKNQMDRRAKIKVREETLQLTLFSLDKHPVLEELESLDITTMSPIEALNKLYELQKKLSAQGRPGA